jgi:hypothetical protein
LTVENGGIVHCVEYQMPFSTNIYCRRFCVWYEVQEQHCVTLRRCYDIAEPHNWEAAAIYAEALKQAHEASEIKSYRMKMVIR